MQSSALNDAVLYWLKTYWSLDEPCEVRLGDAPGKPVATGGKWAIIIHDLPQTFEGKIGFYARYGCLLTFSVRLKGTPVTDIERFLNLRPNGFRATRDALCAFLHKWRYSILVWANRLLDAPPIGGVVTNMVEAPRPLQATVPTRRDATWWGERIGKTNNPLSEEAQVQGYSSDITYGAAKSMQNDTPEER